MYTAYWAYSGLLQYSIYARIFIKYAPYLIIIVWIIFFLFLRAMKQMCLFPKYR